MRREKPNPARLRLAYPYMVKVRVPPAAATRVELIVAAAAEQTPERLEMWSQDQARDSWIVFGFRQPAQAERLRAWILAQGWGDLLRGQATGGRKAAPAPDRGEEAAV
jgi:hypothetical protein